MQEALDGIEGLFSKRGIESARANARMLVAHVLGIGLGQLALVRDDVLGERAAAELEELAARRAEGEPLQYVVGSAPFRYLELEARPGVFIPRPETEVVVQAALDRIAGVGEPRVLDLCCGSGTIAVSVASERADALVTAVDMSAEAVALTGRNAELAGVAARVDVREGDLFAALTPDGDGELAAGSAAEDRTLPGGLFDLVISNPPYIPTAKIAAMPDEVTAWEPMLALDGGEDGLDTFRRIVDGVGEWLRAGGWLVCELDEDMVGEAARLLREDGRFADVAEIEDLTGRPRAVIARLIPC
ncbi:MAG: peptide chain release factor N(5)-glutamine methyltransferase [Coriobacteriales bacterium]